MPLVDMPLADLKNYLGVNPRPNDFEDYWARAAEELAAIDPATEFTPAAFRAPGVRCSHLRFTGTCGSRVHAKFLEPDDDTPRPALILFHGYTGSSGDWMDKLAWVQAGFRVAALDCRGQGGMSEDRNSFAGRTIGGLITRGLADGADKLYFRNVFLDTARMAGILMEMPRVDAGRVATMGGSQGGALALVCAALEPRISRVVSSYPFLSDYRRVWNMDMAENAYEDMRSWFRLFDPLHEQEEEVWTRLGYIDIQHLVPRIRARVLMSVGLMDRITPPSTVFAAHNKLECDKTLRIYPDFGHESLPGFNDEAFGFLAELVTGDTN